MIVYYLGLLRVCCLHSIFLHQTHLVWLHNEDTDVSLLTKCLNCPIMHQVYLNYPLYEANIPMWTKQWSHEMHNFIKILNIFWLFPLDTLISFPREASHGCLCRSELSTSASSCKKHENTSWSLYTLAAGRCVARQQLWVQISAFW